MHSHANAVTPGHTEINSCRQTLHDPWERADAADWNINHMASSYKSCPGHTGVRQMELLLEEK